MTSPTFAANLFAPYYGKYKIAEISCTFNGEKMAECNKWKQVELKADPLNEEYVCVLMKSSNSTSSDCYREESIISQEMERISTFIYIPNGVRFERNIRMNFLEKKYTMEFIQSGSEFTFTRNDQTHFPTTGQDVHGEMHMRLRPIH